MDGYDSSMVRVKPPSTSQVNKAGDVLRAFFFTAKEDRSDEAFDRVGDAIDLLVVWRAAHATPLQTATMGLRSRVETAGCDSSRVSQRLKRMPTILNKLGREPGMKLGRMADVGGCRAILNDLSEVRRVLARYEGSGKALRIRDYVANPKPSGYRAIHVIVDYSGRKIEVQLRTRVMHEWAYMVEMTTTRTGFDVKSGKGPIEVQDWFHAVSEAMAIEEQGLTVDAILAERVSTLRVKAQPHLRVRGG